MLRYLLFIVNYLVLGKTNWFIFPKSNDAPVINSPHSLLKIPHSKTKIQMLGYNK